MNVSVTASDAVDNFEWLEAVGRHPEIDNENLCVAYHLLGVKTDRTEEQVEKGIFWLQLRGYLRVVAISDDQTWTYKFCIPVGAG